MNDVTWAGPPNTRWPAHDASGETIPPPNGLSIAASIEAGYRIVTDARDGLEIWSLPGELQPWHTAAQVPSTQEEITALQVRVAQLETEMESVRQEIVNLRARQ